MSATMTRAPAAANASADARPIPAAGAGDQRDFALQQSAHLALSLAASRYSPTRPLPISGSATARRHTGQVAHRPSARSACPVGLPRWNLPRRVCLEDRAALAVDLTERTGRHAPWPPVQLRTWLCMLRAGRDQSICATSSSKVRHIPPGFRPAAHPDLARAPVQAPRHQSGQKPVHFGNSD